MTFVRDVAGGATLRVRVSPRASRDELAGERDGARAKGRDKVLLVAGARADDVRASLGR